jgi:hypothetical protein
MDIKPRKLSKQRLEEIWATLIRAGQAQAAEELGGHIAAMEEQVKDQLEACRMVVEVDDRAARYATRRACEAVLRKADPEGIERRAGRG